VVEVGLHLPHFGPLAQPDVLDAVIATAERVGIATVWAGDHVAVPADIASRYPYHESGSASFDAQLPYYEPFTLLSYAAGRTRRVGLGVSVLVVPHRHPLLTAKIVGALDRLSGGRVVLGVGVGWLREEFEVLGLDFDARGRVTDDYLDAMCAAWASTPAAFQSPSVSFPPVGTEPRPARRPPLVVGGHSAPALRRALRIGDGWQASASSPEELAALVARLTALAGGRLPEGFRVSSRVHLPRFDPDGSGPLDPDGIRALVRAYATAGADSVVVDLWDRDPARYLARLESAATWLGLPASP
jgi:probable F420-dependent oxidoreductase